MAAAPSETQTETPVSCCPDASLIQNNKTVVSLKTLWKGWQVTFSEGCDDWAGPTTGRSLEQTAGHVLPQFFPHHMHHRELTAGWREGHGGVRKADVSLDTVSLEGTWLWVNDHGCICRGGAQGNKTSRPHELAPIPKMLRINIAAIWKMICANEKLGKMFYKTSREFLETSRCPVWNDCDCVSVSVSVKLIFSRRRGIKPSQATRFFILFSLTHHLNYKSQKSLQCCNPVTWQAAGAGGHWSYDVVIRGWGATASELNPNRFLP